MEDYLEISQRNLQRAREIIDELKIEEVWARVAATANQVGSVKSGLLMCNLDIDFHVYSRDFSIEDSFKAIGRIASNPRIKKVSLYNFLQEEDRSLDWHLHYVGADRQEWCLDIIHIRNDSPYVGKFERVTDKITAALTPERRNAILKIKWDGHKRGIKTSGIEVYKAVIRDNVMNIEAFLDWKAKQKDEGIVLWEPGDEN